MEKRQKFTPEFKREAVRMLRKSGKPAAVVARGVNRLSPKGSIYDLVFNSDMTEPEKIVQANRELIEKFEKNLKE